MAEEKKPAAGAPPAAPGAKKAVGGKTPTALKRALQDIRKRSANRSCKAEIKTEIRKIREMKAQTTEEPVKKAQMNKVYSIVDKAVKKGVLKKNAAARLKSLASL